MSKNCPAGHLQSDLLYVLRDRDVRRCRECHLVFLDIRGSCSEDMVAHNEAVSAQVRLPAALKGWDEYRRMDQRYLEEIKKIYPQKGRILDLGCGVGHFLEIAREDGWDTYGLDISETASAYAREELGLNVLTMELEEAMYPDGFFDVITMWDVIEHLEDPVGILHEISRVLKDGGLLVIKTPSEEGLFKRLAYLIYRLSFGLIDFHLYWLYPPGHLTSFSPQTLGHLLKQAGLQPERAWGEESNYRIILLKLEASKRKKVWKILGRYLIYPPIFSIARLLDMPNKMVMIAKKSMG